MTFVTPIKSATLAERKRVIAYNMDLLIPGLYVWFGDIAWRVFGGSEPDDTPYPYPGMLNSKFGIALVLPGYRIFTTYQGSYDSRQTSN